jgi:type I restriction enzyme M protein
MLLHGVKNNEFNIYHGDSLTNEWDILSETNPAKKMHFDAIVANPPFNQRTRATSKIKHATQFFLFTQTWVLTIK